MSFVRKIAIIQLLFSSIFFWYVTSNNIKPTEIELYLVYLIFIKEMFQ